MTALEQSSDVSVAIQVRTSSRVLARTVPAYTLATLEIAARLVFGLFGVVLIVAGSVCRVLAEPLSIAGRTAMLLAQGEGDDS